VCGNTVDDGVKPEQPHAPTSPTTFTYTTTTNTGRKNTSTMPIGLVIGFSISGCVIVLSLAVGVLIWYRRRQVRRGLEAENDYATVPLNDVNNEASDSPTTGSFPSLSPVYVATNVPY